MDLLQRLKFSPGDKVLIKELNAEATIEILIMTQDSVSYEVRYREGRTKVRENVLQSEIEAINNSININQNDTDSYFNQMVKDSL